MEITEKKNPEFEGNIYWLYECLKVEAPDFPFDKPYTDKKFFIENEYFIYECLMFNEDREDSLFVMQNGVLYEFFSTDKSELLLKLIQYYTNRLKHNYSYKNSNLNLYDKKENESLENSKKYSINKRFKFDENLDPEKAFKQQIRGNIYIEYRDGIKPRWEKGYEIKKLLFYMKFLPHSSKIKIIRIFPMEFEDIFPYEVSWVDQGDQFVEGREAQIQKVLEEKGDNPKLSSLVKRLKNLFYDKYLLNLKEMKLILFDFDERSYILDVENFKFEKYENKHVKLNSEGMFFKYTEKYKGLTKLEKNPQKNADIKKFYDTMINKYNDLFKSIVDDSYLKKPTKDPSSDEVYRLLKPNSPYKLSTLMEPKIGIKTFVKYATYNLWNKDDRISDDQVQ
jgi:hypothetical protein